MTSGPEVKFTYLDLAGESLSQLIFSLDPIGATWIIVSGINYNAAKKSGDPDRIEKAHHLLHKELRDFKHNYLEEKRRRKHPHW